MGESGERHYGNHPMSHLSHGRDQVKNRSDAPISSRNAVPISRFGKGASSGEILDAILHSSLQQLLESLPEAEHGHDPEGLHQYRVGLRRLRTALGLIRLLTPSPQVEIFREQAKWLMGELNDARDWDVFTTQTLPLIAQACPSIAGFDVLLERANAQRNVAYNKARAAMGDQRTRRFQVALGLWVKQQQWRNEMPVEDQAFLSRPARRFAAKILHRLHCKILKIGLHFKHLQAEDLHELRIANKKLRYIAEFFLPLFGGARAYRRYLKALSKLQNQLGRYTDMAVTERLVLLLVKDEIPMLGHQAAGALLGWQEGHLKSDYGDLVSTWKKFKRRDLF